MNLKVVNKVKFVRSIIIMFLLFLVGSLIICNNSFSKTETKYKTIYVASGDTLWSIAKEEQETNPYYKGKNVRNIIEDIKITNSISTSNLKENQVLKIKE